MRRSRSKTHPKRVGRSNKFDGSISVVADREAGKIVRVEVRGHAGFAAAGKDIVCAAVSALVLTSGRGVVRHAGANVRVRDDVGDAYVLEVAGGGARAQAILESTLDGLRAIARSYPGHVRVAERAQGRATASRKR